MQVLIWCRDFKSVLSSKHGRYQVCLFVQASAETSDSDDSDDDVIVAVNRDGTRSSAHSHERRIAAALAKDPWGRCAPFCHLRSCRKLSPLAASISAMVPWRTELGVWLLRGKSGQVWRT